MNTRRATSLAARRLSGVLLAALAAPAALAESSPVERPFERRVYLGAGAGMSQLQPQTTTATLSVSDDRGDSLGLRLGLDLSPRTSVEAYAVQLGSAGVGFRGTRAGEIDYDSFGISLIGYLANLGGPDGPADYDDEGFFRREGVMPYVRAGVGRLRNDSERLSYRREHDNHLALGAGVETAWRNGVALRVELLGYDSDARELMFSVLKRFGEVGGYQPLPVVAKIAPAPLPAPAPEPAPSPLIAAPTVLFEFDRFRVRPEYAADLYLFAEQLLENGAVAVYIDGHTDWIGTENYNQLLSERRAQSVRNFLIERGVDPGRLRSAGFGERRPVASNDSNAGRSRNRRVDIRLQ